MTAKRQINRQNASAKIFGHNEFDLIRAAKLQNSYDEIYDDLDAQNQFQSHFRDMYSFQNAHHLQRHFRDTFIHLMKHKELAEQLAKFNIFVRTATEESALGDAVASRLESVSDYLPFGKQAISPLTKVVRTAADKLGEKNLALREEEKKAATACVDGSAKPPYEVILRLCASALAESCENMLLLMDEPETEIKSVMDYLVNDRMKHALQKKIWSLDTLDKTKKDSSAVINLARNILFSVHIPEKTGGLRFGTKNLIGARYKGPEIKMCGVTIKLEKYLRRQFISYENTLYIPFKKKEAALKKMDKQAVFKSIGADLLLLLLAENGRPIHSSEEKNALDSAFAHTKRGFMAINPEEIKVWLVGEEKLIKKLSAQKNVSALSISERQQLVEQRILAIRQQLQQRQSQSIAKTLQTKLQKQKDKLNDFIQQVEVVADKLAAMLSGLKMQDKGLADYKHSLQTKIDLKSFARLPADILLSETKNLLETFRHTQLVDEQQVDLMKHNLSVLKQALLFKMLDKLPVCFAVSQSLQGDIIWQQKQYEKMSRIDESNALKKALQLLDISTADKTAWMEMIILELQDRLSQCLADVENKIEQGRGIAVTLQQGNRIEANKKIQDFNQQVILYRDFALNLQRDLSNMKPAEFNLDEQLISLKHLRSQVTSLENCLASPLMNEHFSFAKSIAKQPVLKVANQPIVQQTESVALPKLNFWQRIWRHITNLFGITKDYVKAHPVKAGAIGAVVLVGGGVAGAAACITTTAALVKMGVATKAAIATKTLVESGIAGATVAEATLLESVSLNQDKEKTKQIGATKQPASPTHNP